jgi:ABC-type lipoprotein release transport system permease subunit
MGGYFAEFINHRDILGQGDYQVIGFYQIVGDLSQANAYGLMRDTVFIPQKSIDSTPYETLDNLVSFRLTTGTVEAFQQEMEQYDLPGLNFTYYDQGYSKVSAIFTNMRETALLLTLVSAGAGLGLLLFSLLFVGRQQRSIAVMYSLGAGRGKALAFLMLTVALVAVLAVAAGGLAGYVLSGPVLTDTYESNVQAMAGDTDYSGIYGEDTEADFQVVIPPRHHAPLAAAGGVLAVTLVCSGLFAARILRLEPMQVLSAKEE